MYAHCFIHTTIHHQYPSTKWNLCCSSCVDSSCQFPTSETKRKADQIVLFIPLVQLVFLIMSNSHTCFLICFQTMTTMFMLFFHRIPYLRKHWPFFGSPMGFMLIQSGKIPFWKPGVRTTRILWKRYGLRETKIIAEWVMSDLVDVAPWLGEVSIWCQFLHGWLIRLFVLLQN